MPKTKEDLDKQILEMEKKLQELKKKETNVDPEQLKIGIKVEMEHTDSPQVAEKIARDHLIEIPDYYTRLIKMEKEAIQNPTGFEANGLKPEGGDIHGTPNVKRAAAITTPEGNQRGIIVLWEDDHVTVALGDENGHGSVYTTSHPEGSKVMFLSEAWAASLGHKIKPIMVD